MKTYVCKVCGHVAFEEIPDNCPVCPASNSAYFEDPEAIKMPGTPENLSESEKKHVPVLKKLSGSDGVMVTVRVGEILHVMEEKHYITWIDFYLDQKFVGRYSMTPGILSPVMDLMLKNPTGTLTGVENCNIHGRWMSRMEI